MRLDKDDVSAQGLKSPGCVKLLFNSLQNLETEIKNLLLLKSRKLKALSNLTRWT